MKQRELKFRAWTKDGMKHFDQLVLRDCGGFRNPRAYRLATDAVENVDYIHDDFGGEDYDDHIIMQYTGLKDREGRELYEGDVVVIDDLYDPETGQTDPCIAVVEYAGVSLAYVEYFANEGESGRKVTRVSDLLGHVCDKDDDCAIIGNIYENPELLEQ